MLDSLELELQWPYECWELNPGSLPEHTASASASAPNSQDISAALTLTFVIANIFKQETQGVYKYRQSLWKE